MSDGPAVVAAVGELGKPVFADAKLHDIPNTVGQAAGALGRYGARWVTVHASGGTAMMRAAVEGLGGSAPEAGVLAVTVLTSLDEAALRSVGVQDATSVHVARLARLAAQAGTEGVVCSAHELDAVGRAASGLLRVTPGVRPAGGSHDDQARIATPAAAMAAGADLLVIGRPITRAPDPYRAAMQIAAEIGIQTA
jgi:orotidine-5'-phosphate decarboxylase